MSLFARFKSRGARFAAVGLVSMLALGGIGFPGGAEAAPVERLLATEVSADAPVARSCHDGVVSSGPGVDVREVTMPQAGLVRVDLGGSTAGDWDVAVFDAASGRLIAGSASRGTNEVAEGFVGTGQRLIIQACRYSGSTRSADLTVTSIRLPRGENVGERIQVVNVDTPTAADKTRLLDMGFDLSEGGDAHHVGLVLYGADDVERLTAAGFTYDVIVEDLVAANVENRQQDQAYAASVAASDMPSGTTGYRHLADFQAEMKALDEAYPNLVLPFSLPHATWQGRIVEGIEITTNAANIEDGKPVFLIMGVHHAREWPSAEHTMEFAYDLLNGYGTDPTITRLVKTVRTIVIPVVNPDGFNLSREAPIDLRPLGDVHELGHTAAVSADPGFAYKRRNCNMAPSPNGPDCANFRNRNHGVDPNRNYGGFWGGLGASTSPTNDTFRGAGPFSEPETQNIRELVSERQVVMLITNHTFSDLVLRPPGTRAQDPVPDENAMRRLGDRMAEQNGYLSEPGYGLYDTTGTTEDWSYWSTGGFGYTFEIGSEEFHPPYEEVVDEYVGHGAFEGKGNRAAFFLALNAAASSGLHSTLQGRAPAGSILRLTKTFQTPTSADLDGDGNVDTFTDTLESTLRVPSNGQFRWGINPSTRPVVATRIKKTLIEESTRTVEFGPAVLLPGGGDQTEGVTSEDFPFMIGPDDPNAGVKIRIEWGGTESSDWDLYIYRKVGEGLIPMGASASDNSQGPFEEVLLRDAPRGEYVARVVNWLAVDEIWTGTVDYYEAGPQERIPGTIESWTLTCETADGSVIDTRSLTIGRGEKRMVDLRSACAA